MDTTQAIQEIAIINNSLEIFKTAPEVLVANKNRTSKALIVGDSILDQWQGAWALPDEGEEKIIALSKIDERSNTYMANCSSALKQEKEVRASITQLMDNFKKMFTTTENLIDGAAAGTTPYKVQQQRNMFARKLKEIADLRKKEADDRANKDKEHATLIADIEKYVFDFYSLILRNKKDSLNNRFNSATLDTVDKLLADLNAFAPKLVISVYADAFFSGRAFYHTPIEISDFLANSIKSSHFINQGNYAAELSLLRDELVHQLPSKINELDELQKLQEEQEFLRREAESNAEAAKALAVSLAAQKKIEADKAERERLDKVKLDEEEAAARQLEITKIEVREQGNSTMAMFNREESIAEVAAPALKLGFEIIILHAVAYTQIMAFWFEHHGKNLPIDKIGNTKLDQMKAWAEKQAFDAGIKIDSKFLRYDDVVKAKTVKAKAEKL